MKSDWYRTSQEGMYIVVTAGVSLADVANDVRAGRLIDSRHPDPIVRNVECTPISARFGVLGVDDCLRLRDFCVVRSPTPQGDPAIWERLVSEARCSPPEAQ